ncbi:hypothetical protein ACFWG7_04835 [Streptomyces koyangensis]|uniref:hypothetical protein n=1 Tax=Streptomyces koyangensis TaxID=188770 RepID=UPI0036640369
MTTLIIEVPPLRQQAKVHLGQQVEQLGTRALAQRVNELTEENLRLSTAEGAMTAANKELRHQANELTDDLAGARTSVKRMIRNQSR